VKVIDSPDLALSEASVVAVRQWAYEPATRNGQPIAVIMTVAVRFVLQ
jgi:outer membrane biosynthesis protein TonB